MMSDNKLQDIVDNIEVGTEGIGKSVVEDVMEQVKEVNAFLNKADEEKVEVINDNVEKWKLAENLSQMGILNNSEHFLEILNTGNSPSLIKELDELKDRLKTLTVANETAAFLFEKILKGYTFNEQVKKWLELNKVRE